MPFAGKRVGVSSACIAYSSTVGEAEAFPGGLGAPVDRDTLLQRYAPIKDVFTNLYCVKGEAR